MRVIANAATDFSVQFDRWPVAWPRHWTHHKPGATLPRSSALLHSPAPLLSFPSALMRKASNEILKRNIKLAIGHCSCLRFCILRDRCECVQVCVCVIWIASLATLSGHVACHALGFWVKVESMATARAIQYFFSNSLSSFLCFCCSKSAEIDVVWLLIYLMVGKGLNSFICYCPSEHKGCCPLYHCPDWLEWGGMARKKGLVSEINECGGFYRVFFKWQGNWITV